MAYQGAAVGCCTPARLLDHDLHWGGAAFAAAIAVVLPIIGFREFWSEWRFWATLSALALFQLPLVLAVRALAEKPGFPLLYGLTILDCMFVVFGISYVCCGDGDAEQGMEKP